MGHVGCCLDDLIDHLRTLSTALAEEFTSAIVGSLAMLDSGH